MKQAFEVFISSMALECVTLLGCIPVVAPIDGSWADLPPSLWVFITLFGFCALAALLAMGLIALSNRIDSYEV